MYHVPIQSDEKIVMADFIFEPSEVRVDEYRCKGASNWLNRSYNAVRVTHLKTGLFAEMENLTSQHANRNKAFHDLNEMLILNNFYVPTKIYS